MLLTIDKKNPFVKALQGLLAATLVVGPTTPAFALNINDAQVVVGAGSVDLSSVTDDETGVTTHTMNQDITKAIVDWKNGGFNLTVKEVFDLNNGEKGFTLFRDVSGSMSEIFGKITAEGNLMLSNNAGILFGDGAAINVGGQFMGIAGEVSKDAFNAWAAGQKFETPVTGDIKSEGVSSIVAKSNVALLGKNVKLTGATTITSEELGVGLGATGDITEDSVVTVFSDVNDGSIVFDFSDVTMKDGGAKGNIEFEPLTAINAKKKFTATATGNIEVKRPDEVEDPGEKPAAPTLPNKDDYDYPEESEFTFNFNGEEVKLSDVKTKWDTESFPPKKVVDADSVPKIDRDDFVAPKDYNTWVAENSKPANESDWKADWMDNWEKNYKPTGTENADGTITMTAWSHNKAWEQYYTYTRKISGVKGYKYTWTPRADKNLTNECNTAYTEYLTTYTEKLPGRYETEYVNGAYDTYVAGVVADYQKAYDDAMALYKEACDKVDEQYEADLAAYWKELTEVYPEELKAWNEQKKAYDQYQEALKNQNPQVVTDSAELLAGGAISALKLDVNTLAATAQGGDVQLDLVDTTTVQTLQATEDITVTVANGNFDAADGLVEGGTITIIAEEGDVAANLGTHTAATITAKDAATLTATGDMTATVEADNVSLTAANGAMDATVTAKDAATLTAKGDLSGEVTAKEMAASAKSVDVTVKSPEAFGYGTVTVSKVEATDGDIALDATAGLTVTEAVAAGDMALNAGGAVTVTEAVAAGDMTVKATAGAVTVDSASADGDVTLNGLSVKANIEKADNVSLTATADVEADLGTHSSVSALTTAGDVTLTSKGDITLGTVATATGTATVTADGDIRSSNGALSGVVPNVIGKEVVLEAGGSIGSDETSTLNEILKQVTTTEELETILKSIGVDTEGVDLSKLMDVAVLTEFLDAVGLGDTEINFTKGVGVMGSKVNATAQTGDLSLNVTSLQMDALEEQLGDFGKILTEILGKLGTLDTPTVNATAGGDATLTALGDVEIDSLVGQKVTLISVGDVSGVDGVIKSQIGDTRIFAVGAVKDVSVDAAQSATVVSLNDVAVDTITAMNAATVVAAKSATANNISATNGAVTVTAIDGVNVDEISTGKNVLLIAADGTVVATVDAAGAVTTLGMDGVTLDSNTDLKVALVVSEGNIDLSSHGAIGTNGVGAVIAGEVDLSNYLVDGELSAASLEKLAEAIAADPSAVLKDTVTKSDVTLTAANGIGANGALLVAADELTATTPYGDVGLATIGSVTLKDVEASRGDVTVVGTGAMNVNSVTAGGDATLVALGDLLGGDVAGQDVVLVSATGEVVAKIAASGEVTAYGNQGVNLTSDGDLKLAIVAAGEDVNLTADGAIDGTVVSGAIDLDAYKVDGEITAESIRNWAKDLADGKIPLDSIASKKDVTMTAGSNVTGEVIANNLSVTAPGTVDLTTEVNKVTSKGSNVFEVVDASDIELDVKATTIASATSLTGDVTGNVEAPEVDLDAIGNIDVTATADIVEAAALDNVTLDTNAEVVTASGTNVTLDSSATLVDVDIDATEQATIDAEGDVYGDVAAINATVTTSGDVVLETNVDTFTADANTVEIDEEDDVELNVSAASAVVTADGDVTGKASAKSLTVTTSEDIDLETEVTTLNAIGVNVTINEKDDIVANVTADTLDVTAGGEAFLMTNADDVTADANKVTLDAYAADVNVDVDSATTAEINANGNVTGNVAATEATVKTQTGDINISTDVDKLNANAGYVTINEVDDINLDVTATTAAAVTAGGNVTGKVDAAGLYVAAGGDAALTTNASNVTADATNVTLDVDATDVTVAVDADEKATLDVDGNVTGSVTATDAKVTAQGDANLTTTVDTLTAEAKNVTVNETDGIKANVTADTLNVTAGGDANLTTNVNTLKAEAKNVTVDEKDDIKADVTADSLNVTAGGDANLTTNASDVTADATNVTLDASAANLSANVTADASATIDADGNVTGSLTATDAEVTAAGDATLTTDVDTLTADAKNVTVNEKDNINANVTADNLNVTAGGDADLSTNATTLTADAKNVTVAGVDGLDATVKADALDVTVAGDVTLTTDVDTLTADAKNVTVNEKDNINANVTADNLNVTAGGDANLTTNATTLTADAKNVTVAGVDGLSADVKAENLDVTVEGTVDLTTDVDSLTVKATNVAIEEKDSLSANVTADALDIIAGEDATLTTDVDELKAEAKNVAINEKDSLKVMGITAAQAASLSAGDTVTIGGAIVAGENAAVATKGNILDANAQPGADIAANAVSLTAGGYVAGSDRLEIETTKLDARAADNATKTVVMTLTDATGNQGKNIAITHEPNVLVIMDGVISAASPEIRNDLTTVQSNTQQPTLLGIVTPLPIDPERDLQPSKPASGQIEFEGAPEDADAENADPLPDTTPDEESSDDTAARDEGAITIEGGEEEEPLPVADDEDDEEEEEAEDEGSIVTEKEGDEEAKTPAQ